jgi:hypothetical protein
MPIRPALSVRVSATDASDVSPGSAFSSAVFTYCGASA